MVGEENVEDTVGNGTSDAGAVPIMSAVEMHTSPKRRRKRNREEDDVEGAYMQRLADEDSQDTTRGGTSRKRQRLQAASHKDKRNTTSGEAGTNTSATDSDNEEVGEDEGKDGAAEKVPKHESLASSTEALELDKAARTVFLANVSTSSIKSKAAKRTLLSHLTSFVSELPTTDQAHKVESLRFRSTPFPSGVGPKKAAYAKKELMDATTTSTNAYA
ncbi:MAG: hypothetical protein Q9183_007445, partial [Haloplaca sp. 2 TL-2023]